MALTRITKGVIKPNENYDTNNINSTGIVTAIGLDINGNGDVSGNLSVGGVLTYEDVTSIDSVGIITARNGIDCNGDIDVDGHTNLDNVSIAGVTTFSNNVHVGTGVTIETNGQAEIAGITTFYKDVHIKTSTGRLYVGATDRISLMADPSHSYLRINGGHFQIHNNNFGVRSYDGNGSTTLIYAPTNDGSGSGGVQLYHNNGSGINPRRFQTTTQGIEVLGHSELDNVNIAGVSTFTGNIDANGDLDVDGHTNLDNVNIVGIVTVTGDIISTDDIIASDELRNNVAADFWASDNTFINLNGFGNLTHMGGFETNLTSNGYRDTNGQWVSYAANSEDGAAQIGLKPQGSIVFRTDASKANGTTHNPTTRLTIDDEGVRPQGGVLNLKNSGSTGNITANLLGVSGDSRIDLENTGDGNYSGIDFVRERSSGTGVVGGSIFMKSDTSSNNALLYIQAQSASAQSPVTSALSAGNGVRLKLQGGQGIFAVETGASEKLRITPDGYLHLGNTGHGTNKVGGQAVTGNDFDPIFKIYNSVSSKWLMHLRNDHSTAPNGIFMRAGNSSSNYTLYLTGGDEHVKHFIVRGDGKIGIGTDSPVTNLDVRGSSDASITIGLNNGTKYGNFSCDNSATYLYAYNGNDIIFSTHSGNSFNRKVTIKNDGKVGINESAPSEKLQIDGDILLGGQANSSESNYAIKFEYNNHQFAKIVGDGRDQSGYGDIDFYTSTGSGVSNLTQRMTIRANGKIGIGDDNPDGLLTIKGNSDATTTPSIRLLDGTDTREVSITNTSGDFIASTHGTDNVAHGSIKVYDSGIIALSTNSGAGNAERLRVDLNGSVRHMGTAGYWQITVIHNGSGSGNWYSGSAPQRIYPNYIDNRTGYAEFYMTFHPSTSYSGYGEPTFVICGDSYFSTGGTIELNYNGRTNSPNNGTFRCYHGEYSWQIYNDGDTDQVSGQRQINRNVEHRSSSYIASSTQNVDYIASNDGRYGTNSEPIMDQRSYIRIKMNGVGSHNAIQNHPVFVKFTTYTQGDKTWQAYMQYN